MIAIYILFGFFIIASLLMLFVIHKSLEAIEIKLNLISHSLILLTNLITDYLAEKS